MAAGVAARSGRAVVIAGALVAWSTLAALWSVDPVDAGSELCTCGALEQQVASADAVLIGTPIDVALESTGPAGVEQLWRIDVHDRFVGPDSEVLNVSTGGSLSNCRADVEAGRTIGIVAFWWNGHLATSRCGVVEPTTLSEVVGAGDQTAPGFPTVVVIGGIFVVAATGTFVVVTRRRSRPDR